MAKTEQTSLFINRHIFLLLIFTIACSSRVCAQNWESSYNTTYDLYANSDLSSAMEEGEKALALSSNGREKLYTLKLLSTICSDLGEYVKGISYSKQEVELCKVQNAPDSVYIGSLNNLATNYQGNQEYQPAISILNEMVDITQKSNDPADLSLNQYRSDLGYAYYASQNSDSAIYFLSEANKYLLSIDGGAEDYLFNQLTIGQAYYQLNDLVKSLSSFQELKIVLEDNELTSDQLYAETLEGIALIQYANGDYASAEISYEKASITYRDLGFEIEELEELNRQLSSVYLKTGSSVKSDSVRALLGETGSDDNLIINQMSLAYQSYSNGKFSESKSNLNKILVQLKTSDSDELILAEYILLSTRVNLALNIETSIDSVDNSIAIFSKENKKIKEAQAHWVKSRVLQANADYDGAITSLNASELLLKSVTGEDALRYNVFADLLNIHLQEHNQKLAKSEYQLALSSLSDQEYKSKLSYAYAVLLQVSGYNFEAKDVLIGLINGAKYPALLNYQQAIAKIYLDLDLTKKALSTFSNIDEYLKGSSQQNTVAYGENLAQLGRVNVVLGEYKIAEEYYLKGIEIIQSNKTDRQSSFASIYNSYAIFQQTLGSYDKAKSYYTKAKDFSEQDPGLQVDIIQNLATLSQSQGEYPEAIVLLEEALKKYELIYGANHPYYATALQNLANAYGKNGDQSKAMGLLEKAIAIDEKSGLANSISYVNKLHNLGVMLQDASEYDRATEVFQKVLVSRKNQLGDQHPDYVYSLYNMAVLKQRMNQNDEAKIYFEQVIEKYDFQVKNLFPFLSEEEQGKYYAKIKEAFSAYQDFAVEYSLVDPAINADLYNFQINHKAILLNSSKSMRQAIARSSDSQLIDLYDVWVGKKKQLAKYYNIPKEELIGSSISIDDLVNEANAIEKDLSVKSKEFNVETAGEDKNWQSIQKSLKEGEAAVEIIRLKKNIRNDSVWYAVMIVKPESNSPKMVVLKDGNKLEGKFFKLYINSIKFKVDDSISYSNYWQTIDSELKGVKKIHLSSDGIYNKINIGSIYNPLTRSFVLEELTTHNVTNTYEITVESKPMEFNNKFSIGLVGDPLFSQTGKVNQTIKPLPNTLVEINMIDSLASNQQISSIKLNGRGANEKNVKNMESPSVLHFATHGFFLSDKESSGDVYSVGNNPLMKSGLLLSGAGQYFFGDHLKVASSMDEEDNILTALEVLNMNLSNTELVVLSACETGLGEVKNGEGVYGLQRAFVIAGAKSVLMSLWKVDDLTTNELMVLYYQNLLAGINKFDALNMAQNTLKEKYNHPYYWGAFIISGI
jgi:lipopolysaccharide biosynthesis regulator YciM